MTALQDMAGERRFLLIGDSRLISYPNVRDIVGAKVAFIAPGEKQHVPAGVLAACDLHAAVPVGYTRDATPAKLLTGAAPGGCMRTRW